MAMTLSGQDVIDRQRRLAGTIGGWKVMLAPPYAAAPVGVALCLRSGSDWATAAAVRIEVELGLVLARDLPPREAAYGRDEVAAAIGGGHLAIEVLRPEDETAGDAMTVLADGLWNEAIVLGDALPDWAAHAAMLALSLKVEGLPAGAATKGATSAEIMDGMAWLANHAARHFGGLRAGQVVITGARIGPSTFQPGSAVVALGPGGAEVAVRLVRSAS